MTLTNPNSYPYIQNTTTTQTHPIITPTHLQNTPKQKLTFSQLKTHLLTHQTNPNSNTIILNPNFPLFIKTPYTPHPYSQLHSFNLSNLNFSIYKQIPYYKNHPFNHFINYNQTLTYSFYNPYFHNLKNNLFKTIKIKIPYLN